jgi:hypothetical protein
MTRQLRIVELVTVHQTETEAAAESDAANG